MSILLAETATSVLWIVAHCWVYDKLGFDDGEIVQVSPEQEGVVK